MKTRIVIFGSILVVGTLTLSGCGSSAPADPTPTAQATAQATVDPRIAQSDLACVHFRNIMDDADKGLLTDNEFRSKLKEVYGDADIATPDVLSAATGLLGTVTDYMNGDTQNGTHAVLDAEAAMYKACIAAGT